MARIKISLSGAEITLDFKDTKDLEEQLGRIDLARIDLLLGGMMQHLPSGTGSSPPSISDLPQAKEVGTVNLLKVPEGGQDAVKLAVFLASGGMDRDEIKKITNVTLLSS